ncbi:hypothetical protein ACIQXD_18205 [Streptomyces uncialis]|uniref:hypothetical protein n=1 Tax=Streptomyces uncialis TaxID=1048205 RepID=UPI0038026097
MSTLTWVLLIVLVPVALVVVGFGLYMLKAVVQGALEGWRSGKEEDDDAYESPDEVLAQGFLPMERQNTDRREADSPERSRALAAVKGGDWKAAAALMDAAGRDWQARTDLTYQLGDLAADDDSWLLAWENERPDDPTAALLRARSTVGLAWNIRGSRRAKYTTGEQFEGFHRTLARSREEHARAAELAPDDPTPYISELDTAKGLGYPNAEVDRLWDEIAARAPHHFMAHYSALQYWCKKWGGSETLARDFAARAAESAPLGSLLTALPLFAHFEHDESQDTEADRTPRMRALVDAALADAAAADPAHPQLSGVRHILAFYLSLQDRDKAAAELFRLVDGHVGVVPWSYRDDPALAYVKLRDATVLAAAED